MAKYMTKPRLRWDPSLDEEIAPLKGETVYDCDDPFIETGLFDAHGNELCRVRERLSIGFRVRKD